MAEVETPHPKPTEILVKVRASSLNRADLGIIAGGTHGNFGGHGSPLGLEWSGEVVEVGAAVPASIRVGDRMMCSGIGGFAEYAVADWRRCLPFPSEAVSYEHGACLPIALRTAHDAIATQGRLQRGQTILIQGASSAVGLACLQIARLMGAGLVIGTSTNAERRGRLGAFGAGLALDTRSPSWAAQVLEHTNNRGVDVLVDMLAGPLVNDNMRSVALGGRMVNVGRMAGEAGTFDFNLHAARRIDYIGVTFRTRTLDEIAAIGDRVRADLWPALASGELALPIDIRLPLDEVAQACELMRTNAHFGKIVLTQD